MKKTNTTMKDLPDVLKPYEKCKLQGVGALSEDELLAVILRSGTKNKRVTQVARDVISLSEQYGGLSHLSRIPLSELLKIQGIGEVKAVMLACLGELSRRMNTLTSLRDNTVINSSTQAAMVMMDELKDMDVEEAWGLFLDGHGKLVRKSRISRGGINSSVLPVREIFKEALKCGACSIILIHNHPSGNTEPSLDDIRVTSVVKRAAELMDMKLVDHIIIGRDTFLSMKSKGLV